MAAKVNTGQRNLHMRSPMQWDMAGNAGFCNCTDVAPWIPVSSKYRTSNVQVRDRLTYNSPFNKDLLISNHNHFFSLILSASLYF